MLVGLQVYRLVVEVSILDFGLPNAFLSCENHLDLGL